MLKFPNTCGIVLKGWKQSNAILGCIRRLESSSKRKYDYLDRIRNIGVFAHIDAGKTTTTEKMLFYAGIVCKPGNVDDGDTVTDFLQEERDRGITIQSAAISFPWKNSIINLVDTPGHVDFSIEVERCLRVLDGGVAILDGVAGVEAQTETVWEQANRYKLPRILYINKLDRIGASFENCIQMMKQRLDVNALALQYPYMKDDMFEGIVNIVEMKYTVFNEEGEMKEMEIPKEIEEKCKAMRVELIEELAENDNRYSDLFLEGNEEEMGKKENIYDCIRRLIIRKGNEGVFDYVPVVCGSSLKNQGIQPLLDMIDRLLPSPLDVAMPAIYYFVNNQLKVYAYQSIVKKEKSIPSSLIKFFHKDPLIMYAFKIQHTSQGMMAYFRIYNGSIKNKEIVYNTRTKKEEKVMRILQISADHTEALEEARSGQIIAIHGLSAIRTGDTYVSNANQCNIQLEPIRILPPVFTVNVEAENQTKLNQLEKILTVLTYEDPSLHFENDEDSGQLLLSGMGELHLEVIQQRLKREYGIEAYYSRMRVNYRESVIGKNEYVEVYDKEINGEKKHIQLGFSIEDCSNEENEVICDSRLFSSTPMRVTEKMCDVITKTIQSCLTRGPLLGYSMSRIRVTLNPAKSLWDSASLSPAVLQAAVFSTLSSALRKHKTILLEPIMKYEASISTSSLGDVLSDLTAKRRGEVREIETVGSITNSKSIIHGEVPLAEMIGYSSMIRILTGGETSFSLAFEKYGMVPDELVEKVRLL